MKQILKIFLIFSMIFQVRSMNFESISKELEPNEAYKTLINKWIKENLKCENLNTQDLETFKKILNFRMAELNVTCRKIFNQTEGEAGKAQIIDFEKEKYKTLHTSSRQVQNLWLTFITKSFEQLTFTQAVLDYLSKICDDKKKDDSSSDKKDSV